MELAAEEARLGRDRDELVARLQTVTDARAAALARLDAEARKSAADLDDEAQGTGGAAGPRGARRQAGRRGTRAVQGHLRPQADDAGRRGAQAKAIEEAVGRLEAEAARLEAERTQVDENYRAGRELISPLAEARAGSPSGPERRKPRRTSAAWPCALATAGPGELDLTPEAVDRTAAARG